MLDEREWEEVSPLLRIPTDDIGARRQGALDRYFEITGFRETEPNAIFHHRISLHGPPCEACGKPLRTSKATWCAACGAHTDKATVLRRHRQYMLEVDRGRGSDGNAEMQPPILDSQWPPTEHCITQPTADAHLWLASNGMKNILFSDKDWSVVADRCCEVTSFHPFAEVKNGQVISKGRTTPLAMIGLKCSERGVALQADTFGAILHKEDFKRLWSAFVERHLNRDETICVTWSKQSLRAAARLLSMVMPRLAVIIFTNESYELLHNPDYRPDLQGEKRFYSELPICLWQPEVWKEPIVPTRASL